MSTVGEIVAKFTANTADFDRGIAGVQAKTAELGASTQTMAKVGAAAWTALGVAAVGFGVIAVKQAQEQEVATARLKQAVNNVGQSYSDYADQITKAENAGVKLGFADDEITTGLAKMVPVTKDVHRAITDMGLAEDIARGRHIELSAATDLLAKVETGHVALLGRIGINTKDATGATISQEEAIRRLTDMYGGQAAAYTQTFAGRIEVLKAQFGQLAEKVGFVLIPILENLMTGISDTIGFFERNRAAAYALAVIIGGPLVSAMVTFAAVKIGAVAESMATSFVTLRAAIGSTLESMGLLGEGAGAAALGLGMLAGGLALALAAGYGLHLLFGSDVPEGFKKGADQAKQFGDVLQSMVSKADNSHQAMGLLRDKLKELEQGQRDIEASTKADGGGFDEAAQKAVFYKDAINLTKGKIAELKAEQQAKQAVDAQTAADVQAVADHTTNLANATDAAKRAIQDYQSVVLATSNTELGRQQAVLNVTKAQNDYNAAVEQYGPTSAEAQAASLNLQQAQLQVVSSSLAATDATDAFNAATSKNPALIQATIAKLQEEIQKHGDATGAVQAYIDKLKNMQFTIDGLHGTHIVVTADTYAAVQGILSVVNAVDSIVRNVVVDVTQVFHKKDAAHGGVAAAHGIVAMARGGWVTSGPQFALIGEDGPEAVLPFTKFDDMVATIANTGQAPKIARAANQAAGGGGGQHFHGPINITVVSPDPAAAGAAVRSALFLKGRS